MEELLRTRSGQFALADSLTLDQIQTLTDQGEIEKHLIGIEEILGEHPVPFLGPENGRQASEKRKSCNRGADRRQLQRRMGADVYKRR